MKTDKLVAGENLRKLDPPLIFGEAFEALWTKKGSIAVRTHRSNFPISLEFMTGLNLGGILKYDGSILVAEYNQITLQTSPSLPFTSQFFHNKGLLLVSSEF